MVLRKREALGLLSSGDGVSVWEDANVLEMDGGDVNNSVNILNRHKGQFYVIYILLLLFSQ